MEPIYHEAAQDKRKKLEDLKERIRGSHSVFDYAPTFGGKQPSAEQSYVRLAGLEAFGERFLQDTWSIIDARYPFNPTPPDPVMVERYCSLLTMRIIIFAFTT